MSANALRKKLDDDRQVSHLEEAMFTEAEDVAEKSTDIMLTRKCSNMEIVNAMIQAQAHRLGAAPRDLVLVSVQGDSMMPALSRGDMVLVDTRLSRVDCCGVYVLQGDGYQEVKRIQPLFDGALRVIHDNKKYQDELVDAAETFMLNVFGRVVWKFCRM